LATKYSLFTWRLNASIIFQFPLHCITQNSAEKTPSSDCTVSLLKPPQLTDRSWGQRIFYTANISKKPERQPHRLHTCWLQYIRIRHVTRWL